MLALLLCYCQANTNAFTLVVPGRSFPVWLKVTNRKIAIRLKTPTETLAAYEQAVIDFKAKTTTINALGLMTKNPMAKSVLHVKAIIDEIHMYLDNVQRVIAKLDKFTSSRTPPA